jgi:hypothetical protein
MSQANPFDQFDSTPAAPGARTPSLVLATPKTPTPQTDAQAQNDVLGVQTKQAELQDRPLTREVKRQNIKQGDMQMAGSLRDDYNQQQTVKDYKSALPIYGSALHTPPTPQGDLAMIYGFAKVMDPGSVVREGEVATAANTQPLIEKYAAQFDKQFRAGGTLTDDARQKMREALAQRMGALNQAFIAERVRYKGIADRNGVSAMDVVGEHPGGPFQDEEAAFLGHPVNKADYNGNIIAPATDSPTSPPSGPNGGETDPLAHGFRPENEPAFLSAINAYIKSGGATPEGLKALHDQLAGGKAIMTPQDAATAIKMGRINGFDYSKLDEAAQAAARAEAERQNKENGDPGGMFLGLNGATFNQLDRIDGLAGGASALLSGDNPIEGYQTARDATRLRLKQARENAGGFALPAELAGGMLTGGALGKGLAREGATTLEKMYAMGKVGAAGGAITGSNSGGTLGDDLKGAIVGGGLGAVIGGASAPIAERVGGKLAAIYSQTLGKSRAAQQGARDAAQPVVDAGIAENVPVYRAMVDPSTAQQVTRAQGSLFGGGRVTRDMNAVNDAIETGVNRLGDGGTAMTEPSVAGQTVQSAAERYIKQSGAVAKRQYDKAERLAGDTRVAPTQAVARIDDVIAKLSETKGINAPEIGFLETLKGDLTGDLSVAALRRLRTKLRQKVSKGDLTFGENEADVLGVMDAASQDISAGLEAAGKGDAARAFSSADTAYRQRMEFIGGTVQKLVGKRNSNMTPEATFDKFKAMASPRGDEAGLGKMMAQMEPGEAADIRATLASTLGRNKNGEFSTAFLINQANNLPRAALVHIFGEDGVTSIDNLAKLARASKSVTDQFNHSKTGVARAGDVFRSSLMTLAGFGGGAGLSSVGTGLATAATTGAGLAARDMLSARALMSTNLTRWMTKAPKTPADIQSHIARLSVVAAREPAISGEVLALQQRLSQAFGATPQRLAAAPGSTDEGQK